MPSLFRLSPALALLALSACAENPTSAGDILVPSEASVAFVSATDSVRITATVNGTPYSGIRLRLREETRAHPALPVLDAPALLRGVVRPAGPGSAVLEVLGGPGLMATLPVTVNVATPTVFGALTTDHGSPSDTTYLYGVLLDGVGDDAVDLAGATVPILERRADRLALPAPAGSGSCDASSEELALEVRGATISPRVRVAAAGEADIALSVGEWRVLTPREAGCLRFADGQEYVLSFVDAGPVEAVRDAWTTLPFSQFSVTVADRTGGSGSALRSAGTSALAPRFGDLVSPLHAPASLGGTGSASVPVGGCSDVDFTNLQFLMWCRSKPWVVGDTMRLVRPHSQVRDTVRATVYAVHDFLVFAAIDGDASADLLRLRATMDSVMPQLLQHAVPFFREMLGPVDPTSSVASGQLLTLIGDFSHGSVGGGCCANNATWSSILLGSTLASDRVETLYLMAHELAHAYQRQWMFDRTPEGGAVWNTGPVWAIEGGADLLTYEVLRRLSGLPWAADAEVTTIALSTGFARPLAQEGVASGNLVQGYADASSFLRDVVARLVARGTPLSDAYRTVAQGSLEDWFGHEPFAEGRRLGLTARMEAALGGPWDPIEALLLYFLSQGADERVNSTVLRNPFWKEAWREFGGDNRNLELRLGTGNSVVTGLRLQMGGGTVRLVLPAGRSAVALTATKPAVRWALARTR